MIWLAYFVFFLYVPIVLKAMTIGVTWKAFNPLWWFLNADHSWAGRYEGERFGIIRWHLRNPLHNYFKYCIGIGDRFKAYVWREDMTAVRDFPIPGLHVAYLVDIDGGFILPCLQYKGERIEWYIGWRANGAFGMALRASGAN